MSSRDYLFAAGRANYKLSPRLRKPKSRSLEPRGPGGAAALPELAMPRDSQLLPPISRALLRAARAGCIYIRQSGQAAEERENKDATDAEDQAAAAVHMADRSFTNRKWTALPKHLEPPEVEFLAKRRPGLPSLYGGVGSAEGGLGATPGPMRRTKFQKVDPETGNISIYEAWVPEGHRIEGEVSGDVQTLVQQSNVPVKPETPAPGTVVEGVGVVNSEGVVVAEAGSASVMTPPKRRPPPPKRKGKGIGKGRKKKVMFAPGEGADATTVHGIAPTEGAVEGAKEGDDASRVSVDQSGQDEEEEEGEDGDESDEGDESMMDAKTPETPQAPPSTELAEKPPADTAADQSKDVEMTDAMSVPQSSVSQPAVDQESLLQPSNITSAPQAETPQNGADISASTTRAPSTGSTEQLTAAGSTTEHPPSAVSTEASAKEESQAPEPTPLPTEDSAMDTSADDKPIQKLAEPTPGEVKLEPAQEPRPQPTDESVAAPSDSPGKPIEETPLESTKKSEPTQSAEELPVSTLESEPAVDEQPQSPTKIEELAPADTHQTTPNEPEVIGARTNSEPVGSKEDVEMGGVLSAEVTPAAPVEEAPAASSPVKTASLIPPASAESDREAAAPEPVNVPAPKTEAPIPEPAVSERPSPPTDPTSEKPSVSAPESEDAEASASIIPEESVEPKPEADEPKKEPESALAPAPGPEFA
ncbi:hypothetical protein N7462_001616 [Penicillium macrosclerotiorum]|uniref:uncharacterized protein n=1 Tax=Penicillium macrosclerotiorum TaxID=303699 RepID=UPI00254934F3|nr:uncharacterized protein N7462_001616 [Penicillium macrosclerotiorum]KAJ5692193.1 hypothetical protein N7462_001616 [Penicillium macrosclerotiorum]